MTNEEVISPFWFCVDESKKQKKEDIFRNVNVICGNQAAFSVLNAISVIQ